MPVETWQENSESGRAVCGVNILIPWMHRGRLSATVCMHLSCEQGAIDCSKERGVKWHR
jgi:hypothetical protein